ncbi:IclR family transcriptional regulator [Rubrobacter xylanophilus]|uniref:IclR family transcriptional regulator n=1 Tax=Rubrobacter xylanophilus TaxID=49319 RepID=UPI00155AF4FD|nr:IclR family transcriptional regulator [Rubrobacter xylanophilus]
MRAVERASSILEALRICGKATLHDLARRSGLPKPSAFRMLRTLENAGLVERLPDTDLYRLGVRCLILGQAYLEQTDLRAEARPILERLREEFDETVHLAVLDGELRVVYLDKLETAHAVGLMMSRVGRTVPSYCTGIGKALLANQTGDPVSCLEENGMLLRYTPNTICDPHALRKELKSVRERGYALDLEEHEPGVRCVASPVFGPDGSVVAGISIAGPANRLPKKLLQGKLAEATMRAAREISYRMGASC